MAGFVSKTIVFVINFIFLLCALAVMIFGIITLSSPTTVVNALSFIPGYENLNYVVDVQQAVLNGGILMTVVGSVITLMCLFGLAASCTNGTCFLGIYSGMVLLVLYFEIGCIIFFSVESQYLNSRLQDLMYTSLTQYFEPVQIESGNIVNGSTPGALAWESMQFTYACCGAHGYEDFQKFNWKQNFTYNPNAIVPPSCCEQIVQYEFPDTTSQIVNLNSCLSSAPQYVNTKGCYIALTEIFYVYGYVKMITLSGLIAVEVLVLMLSFRLMTVNRREMSVTTY